MIITNQFIKNIFTDFARPVVGSRNHCEYQMFNLINILDVFCFQKKKINKNKKIITIIIKKNLIRLRIFRVSYENC